MERFDLSTASAHRRPDLIMVITDGGVAKGHLGVAGKDRCHAGAPPLYGMFTILVRQFD